MRGSETRPLRITSVSSLPDLVAGDSFTSPRDTVVPDWGGLGSGALAGGFEPSLGTRAGGFEGVPGFAATLEGGLGAEGGGLD